MAEKRRGLGRGLGALIPSVPEEDEVAASEPVKPQAKTKPGRPVDVFFPESSQVAREDVSKSLPVAPEKPSLPDGVDEFTPSTTPEDAGEEMVSRETLVDVPGATFAEISVFSIHPNRKQPRNVFDEDDMAELVHSLKEIGMLQPIVVRPSMEGGEAEYELVMGERRWRAAKEAELPAIPAIIRKTSDDDLLRDALLENLHRSELNPLEEAAAYQQLLEDFGCTHEELADRLGRSRPQVSNMLRLMKLPPLVQRRVAAGVLSAGHARALLSLTDQAEMEKLAQRIVSEGLSVRATEEIVAMSDGLKRPVRSNRPQQGARHERLDYLATSLSDRLDTSVKITLGARKGKVAIEFASVDDLNRIMGVLNPASD
ncbi:MAG TPA: ParB/RepB/Spo0J family partition protein [Arthrobacter sp.]|nr:ParB/RepB/Spo0J family partition protein [Arthrobacter sp.]